MDIISTAGESIVQFYRNLPTPIYSFLLRANIAFGLPAVFVYLGFRKAGWRNKQLNRLLLVVGFLLGISIQFGNLDYYSPIRPWITLFFTINIAYLPSMWSFLLAEKRLVQKRIHRVLLTGLFLLFIINLFQS